MSFMTHLWEVDHPYYASEGNYFSNDCHREWESWADFFYEFGDSDPDMNLVYRWDWRKVNPDEYDGEEDVPDGDLLTVYFVGQRKAMHFSSEVIVQESDEPEVRKWLTERAKTIAAIWNPILLSNGSETDET